MAQFNRRTFFQACALGAVVASAPAFRAGASPWPIPRARVAPPVGVLTRLPGEGTQLALTVDDGCSTADVATIGQFCAATGMRLTFSSTGTTTPGPSTLLCCNRWSPRGRSRCATTPGPIRTSLTSAPLPSPTRSRETPRSCATRTVSTELPTSDPHPATTTPTQTALPPTTATAQSRCEAPKSGIRYRPTKPR